MLIVPVMDVRNGEVVRAAGGDRSAYEPLESDLCPTAEPLPFAFALRERFGCAELYLADLNAIAGETLDTELLNGLVELGFNVWVDGGVRDVSDALRIRQTGCSVVVGSETLAGLEAWERILRAVDGRKLALSLDLRDGALVRPGHADPDPMAYVNELLGRSREVAADAPSRLFVIDLNRVGSGRGVGTESVLERCARLNPECPVFAGGGVRGPADIARLERLGLAGALVSSALHEATLQPGVYQ
jgi:phosphoribosylformimino-5-aminoimidazole carboxamide ribotide isomerase